MIFMLLMFGCALFIMFLTCADNGTPSYKKKQKSDYDYLEYKDSYRWK